MIKKFVVRFLESMVDKCNSEMEILEMEGRSNSIKYSNEWLDEMHNLETKKKQSLQHVIRLLK
jgi:hypothetical protein